MINKEVYNALDPKLILDRDKASRILHRYNKRCFHEYQMHNRYLKKLLNTSGRFWIKPSFRCDYGYNIYIGKNVRIGGGAIINPNVHIGDNCVIGAGSVVTKDVPSGILAYGNPCKIIRKVDDFFQAEDSVV